MTVRFGTCEMLLISDSVMPSERYSISASLLSNANGITAMDPICLLAPLPK